MFLKVHQLLTLITVYALWRHLSVKKLDVQIYILIVTELFSEVMIWQVLLVVFCNFIFDNTFAWADVTQNNDMIKISLTLSQLWNIQMNQYVNLHISFISFWSFLQSHLFIIVLWT